MTIQEILMHIQNELVAPKKLFNKFGNYNYRSAESILESVKPLLKKYNVILTVSDEIINIGDRYYIKATARLIALDNSQPYEIETTAYAREDESLKGMSEAQVTGSTSSYARKYALNGLLAIDDTKDSDSTNTHGKEPTEALKDIPTEQVKGTPQAKSTGISEKQVLRMYIIAKAADVDKATVDSQIKTKLNKIPEELTRAEYDKICTAYEGLKKGEI